MNSFDLIIIGAGAAGLFAAGKCSSGEIKTAVFDSMNSPGRKLLLTGQGRCNITNSARLPEFITRYGNKERFVRKCLYSFGGEELTQYLSVAGLELVSRDDGKVFPTSERASDVLKCLLRVCRKSYIDFNFGSRVASIEYNDGVFTLASENGISASAPRLLIAAGGYTFPSTGSRGDGFKLAASLGHNIITPRPALSAVSTTQKDFTCCAGISIDAASVLFRDNKKISRRRGALLFTHTGLSGPLIIDNSREMRPGDSLEVSLLPDYREAELSAAVLSFCAVHGRSRLKSFLTKLSLPERLAAAVFERAGLDPGKTAAEITKKERNSLLRSIEGLTFTIERLDGKNKAMCTSGGVDTAEINPSTMESRLISGLYFAGEVIDVDGDSGGYNLQFAFSSAFAASESITAHQKRK
ncbi:MAG: aminoacetone oxidase family FAD-binding enzyme [Spirochaetales bacterium]|nr:aminoacetone oxidase family FAD-binding enzyme [Spirochaetales bacterium]